MKEILYVGLVAQLVSIALAAIAPIATDENNQVKAPDAVMPIDPSSILGQILSVIPSVTAMLCFVVPIKTVKLIIDAGSTMEFPLLPYLSMAVQSLIWLGYGIMSNNMTVIVPNVVGTICGIGYTAVYDRYHPNRKALNKQYLIGALIIVVVGTIVLVTSFETGKFVVSIFACSGSMLFAASPLSTVATVVKHRSVESMPFHLSLILFLNGFCWTTYALLVRWDMAVFLPNMFGTLAGSIQLMLHVYFGLIVRPPVSKRTEYETVSQMETVVSNP